MPTARALLVAVAVAGCAPATREPADAIAPGADAALDARVETPLPPAPPLRAWPTAPFPPVRVPPDNPVTAERVELGRLLFHDPVLSADRQTACVTCHSQYWGMSDGLARSIGTGGTGPAGVGRRGPTHTRRNALSLWNAAYRAPLFWDGRADSLESQVAVPLEDPLELGRPLADSARELAALPAYVPHFRRAFPGEAQPVTALNVRRALASFVRTLVSANAPYDQYVRGDRRALSDLEARGLARFTEAGCGGCHVPPLFDSDRFARVAPVAPDAADQGRFEVTGLEADRGAFRVPTLRNLRDSGPYLHDGSAATIEAAIELMARHGLATQPLSPDDVTAIAAFLRQGLVDRSREPVRPDDVPSGLAVPLDGFRTRR